MAVNLIDMAKNYITPDVVEKLGNATGLSPEQTQRVVGAAVPTALSGVLNNVSTEQGAKRVFDTLKQGSFDGSMLDNFSERLSGGNFGGLLETGHSLLGMLFGDRTDSVSESLSRSTGVDRSSGMKILAFVAPFVMNLLGKVKKEQGLSEKGFREFLMSQKDTIVQHVPSGLAGALGLSSLSDLGGVVGKAKEKAGQWLKREGEPARNVSQETYENRNKAPGPSRTLWIALAALVLLGVFWFMRGRGREMAEAPRQAPETETPAIRGEPTGNTVPTPLPNGQSLQLERGSTAQRLAAVLSTGADQDTPIEFRELVPGANQSDASAASARAIDPVAQVLKAYPDARIRIRGSAPGDDEAARQSAVQRAERVKDMLVERGVLAERMTVDSSAQAAAKPGGSGIEFIVESR